MKDNVRSYSSRWILVMPAECVKDDLSFMGATIRVISKLSEQPIVLLVENIVSTESSIENAFYVSWENINLFTIACSYIGYGSSRVIEHVATLPTDYQTEKEFDVLIQRVMFNERNTSLIKQADLDVMQNTLNSPFSDAVICLSLALRTQSIEEKATLMHSACQEIAKNSGVPNVKQTCNSCKTETDTGRPATNNYIREIFKKI